jgi:hypothetical protein
MSESLIHDSVANQVQALALLAGADCESFQHQVIDSKVAFAGPGEQNIFNLSVAANTALVITSLDIKVLYDTADAALDGDFRSSFDLNPYGPYVGAGAVGTIRFLVNADSAPPGQQVFATAYDIGVMNQGILFVFRGEKTLQVKVNPLQPAGKNITLVSRLNTFIVVPEASAVDLEKKATRIVTATNVP